MRILGRLAVLLLVLYVDTENSVRGDFLDPNPLLEAARKSSSVKKLDECFCELSGPVDVCCCDVETVDSLNHDIIHPMITDIVRETFFRFYKINLNRDCPFWLDDGRCVLKDCHVEKCSEEQVPLFLKEEGSDSLPTDLQEDKEGSLVTSCDEVTDEERALSTIVMPSNISDEHRNEFNEWSKSEDNFCHLEDDSMDEGSYVDLVLNPERYTGYSGHSPHRIWSAIYNENCFRENNLTDLYDEQELCLEKRAFYRLISGLHSSINIHLSAEYILSGSSTSQPKFGPNLNEFVRRFDSSKSNGQGPGWLKNLYFAYLVVLRAVIKAEDVWTTEGVFRTLNEQEDLSVQANILELVKAVKGCGQNLFDESQMFNGDASRQLKEEFRTHFRNISRIMDCVGCNKCRLWGTVQVQGIGTALKILFNGRRQPAGSTAYLTRPEIVTLFNVLARLSESVEYLRVFKHMKVLPTSTSASKNTEL